MLVQLSNAARVAKIVYTLFTALSALLAIFFGRPPRMQRV